MLTVVVAFPWRDRLYVARGLASRRHFLLTVSTYRSCSSTKTAGPVANNNNNNKDTLVWIILQTIVVSSTTL